MKQTSKLVLSLLFAKVAAADGTDGAPIAGAEDSTTYVPGENTPEAHEHNHDFVNDIQEQSDLIWGSTQIESPFHTMDISIMADEYFTLYANGVVIGMGGDYLETYDFQPEVRESDSIAVEIQSGGRWRGNFIANFGGTETGHDEWHCKDVPDDGQLPNEWNLNHYDDRTWAAAVSVSGNTRETSTMRGFTNPLFSDEAQFVWSSDPYSTHVICRLNHASFEDRNKAVGECDAEMSEFQRLLNDMILHHQDVNHEHREEIRRWEDELASAHNRILDLESQLVDADILLNLTIENHEGYVQHLQDSFDNEIHELEERLSSECAAALVDKEAVLNAEFEATKADIKAEHDDHVADLKDTHAENMENALQEAADNHADAMADKVAELNNQFNLDLANALADQAGEHAANLEQELATLTHNLTSTYDKAIFDLNQEWEDRVAALRAEWVRQSEESAEAFGAEIDRLTRKHDYLYESCTTVQVVDGELVVGN